MLIEKNPEPKTSEKTKKQHKVPEFSEDQIKKIHSCIPNIRKDISSLIGHYDKLKKNYPNEFARVFKKHPDIEKYIMTAREILKPLGENNKKLSNEQIYMAINSYNHNANKINYILNKINREEIEKVEKKLTAAVYGEMEFDESNLSLKDKEELRSFAKDLWKELFPESNSDKFYKWVNGGKELEPIKNGKINPDDFNLKLKSAVLNGVESAVVGIINLTKPKTYSELYDSIATMSGLSYEDWSDLWRSLKFINEQIPTEDKASAIISFVCSVAVLYGGIGKIISIANKLGYSTKTINTLTSAFKISRLSSIKDLNKATPLGAILGISLHQIEYKI